MIPLKRGLAKYSLTSRTPSSCCSLIKVKVLIPVSWHNGLDIQRRALQPSRGRWEGDRYSLIVTEIARTRGSLWLLRVFDLMGTQTGSQCRERGHARL